MSDPKAELNAAAVAISTAATVLKLNVPVMERFLKECRDMENFGYLLHPTLAKDSERQAVSALMEPLFKAAVEFVKLHDAQASRAKDALAKVSA